LIRFSSNSSHHCCLSGCDVGVFGQTVGWIKTPFGTEVDLGPGHIVLDGDPAAPKGAPQPPLFCPCLLWQTAGWIKMPRGKKVGLSPGDIVLDGDQMERGQKPPLFGPYFYCGQTVAHLSCCWALDEIC